ncbi:MAG: PsbP-related protein [bacterium]|nr:PsbP-related protein [bacterium]
MNNQKGFANIILIVVIVAIVAVGGYFAFVKKTEPIVQQPTPTPATTPTQTPKDETSNLKTYSNSDLKYSIKYPTDWILDAQYINDGTLFLLTKQRKQNLDAEKIARVFDVSIKVYKSSAELPNNEIKKLSFENWIKQEADSYGFIQRKSIVVDGTSGYQGIGSGDGESYLVFVQKGNLIYQLETGDTTKPTETEQKVIDSFKFL